MLIALTLCACARVTPLPQDTSGTARTYDLPADKTQAKVRAASADPEISDFHEETLAQTMPLPDLPEPPPAADFQPSIAEPGLCPALDEATVPMVAPGHLILLGDPFGAHEPWEALDRFTCGITRAGVPLTIAISVPRTEQAALNTFLASAGTQADRKALISTPFWSRVWQDGRSSRANALFIEHVRARRAAGAKVNLLALEPDASGNVRQATIAATLLRAREAAPDRLIVVMSGNVNIAKRRGTQWDSELYPFGARLSAVLPDQTHAFDVSFEAGLHWTCHSTGTGELKCGTWEAHPGPSQRLNSLQAFRDFRLFEHTSPEGYDGLYYVGPLSASAPAGLATWKDEGSSRSRLVEDPFVTP